KRNAKNKKGQQQWNTNCNYISANVELNKTKRDIIIHRDHHHLQSCSAFFASTSTLNFLLDTFFCLISLNK
ncbi:hypothetical protein DOY81_001755, partial [Sarcophaga bullata]